MSEMNDARQLFPNMCVEHVGNVVFETSVCRKYCDWFKVGKLRLSTGKCALYAQSDK